MLAAVRAAFFTGDAFLLGVDVRTNLLPDLLEDALQYLPVLTGELFAPGAGLSLAGFPFCLLYSEQICRIGRHIVASIPIIGPREK
jgi:hypothetical protein